ncbi:MAG: extracellular solute-binding protein [Oscillospiraceae bacterium]|nr:extracellular solute-binding protein [Oscillospiraceae bacterium]
MKKVLCIFLSLCLLLLSGCHGELVKPEQEEETTPVSSFQIPANFDTSKNYEISFWAKNDTNMTQVGIYKQAIEDFQQIYPNIKVNLRLYTDYGKIYNDVITNIPTNTTPNVCITYPDHIATYLTGEDTVVPLDGLLTDPVYGLGGSGVAFDAPTVEQVIPKFLEECAFDGHYYAVPYMRSTEACYVNKTFVEKLGYTLPEVLTWDFVWEVSDAAAKKDADGNFLINGQKVMIPFLYKSTDNMMIQMLKQQGAGYSADTGEIFLNNDTTMEILKTVAAHTATGAFSTFKINGYPANFLNAGQCIFAVDSTAGATWMGSNAPLVDIAEEKLVEFETVVMPIPQFDTQNPQMISQGPSMCLFNKEDPQEVLASWLFAQFMLTDGVQIAYAQTEGYAPVTAKAQQSDTYQDYLSRRGEDNDLYYDIKIDATRLLLDNTDKTFVAPVFNGSASLRNAAGQLIENVTKTVRRGKELNYDAVYQEVSALYRLDQIQVDKAENSEEFGPLPAKAIALLAALAACWLVMGVFAGIKWIKNRKKMPENIDFSGN